MDPSTAARILSSLAHGRHPGTGEEVELGEHVEEALRLGARLCRWFAAAPLRDEDARSGAGADPEGARPNEGAPWTAEDDAKLVRAWLAGEPATAAARNLGRSPGAIRARLARVGLIEKAGRAHDERFRERFEAQVLVRAAWGHRALVRLARQYLLTRPPEEVEDLLRLGIQALDAAHGVDPEARGSYHATNTHALVRRVAHAVRSRPRESFAAFAADHPELLDWRFVTEHYSEEVLRSREARRRVLPPDRAPLPAP